MDESWRMSIGDGARRRSIVNPNVPADDDDDFRDVFGGPPRILRHRRPADAGFYKEVFSPPLAAAEAAAVGTGRRNLPGFCIPPPPNSRRSLGVGTEDGFYDDIFGSSHLVYTADGPARDRRSRSRSTTTKSSSSNNCKSRPSNSSFDHDSSTSYLINSRLRTNRQSSIVVHHHHHHHHHHDATLSSFSAKLRPITIPTRQHNFSQPSTLSGGGGGGGGGEGSSNRTVPISNIQFSSFADNKAAAGSTTTIDFFQPHPHRPEADFSYSTLTPSAETRSSYYCRNCCRKETMTNNCRYRFSGACSTPSSVASSAALEPILSTAPMELRELEKKVVVEVKKERERYFANHHSVRETEGTAALDEAIAWARGKFWNQQDHEILEYPEEPKGISK